MASESDISERLLRLPLFLSMFGISAVSMLLPAAYGYVIDDESSGRAFFYTSLIGLFIFTMIAVARAGRPPGQGALGPLLSLFCAFVFLPIFLAVPFVEALPTTRFVNAYFEMVSALTTTGAALFDDPGRLSPVLHLWRGQVAWMGGLLMWIAAVAILAPLHLGGFEVTSQAEPGRRDLGGGRLAPIDPRARILRAVRTLFPLYSGLTLLLWLLLIASGERSLGALMHAMSVLSTSGISPMGGVQNANAGLIGEAVMLLFMLFALSRLTFSKDTVTATQGGLMTDPEFRIGIAIILGVPLLLFMRHWVGAIDVETETRLGDAGRAAWGSIFTVTSFLTTTGFVSDYWAETQNWSGLSTPGLILMGLALVGGGVATTAGGVKLLRVFALYVNGVREMERLVHPSSVSGAGLQGRRLQSNGAFIAWIFFMLFALSLAAVTLGLTLTGVRFDAAMVLSVATLSTTGPVTEVGLGAPIALIELSVAAKGVLCAAMVVGRLETLAIIALLTPDLWRS